MLQEPELSCKGVFEFGTKDKNQNHISSSQPRAPITQHVFLEKVPLKVNSFFDRS